MKYTTWNAIKDLKAKYLLCKTCDVKHVVFVSSQLSREIIRLVFATYWRGCILQMWLKHPYWVSPWFTNSSHAQWGSTWIPVGGHGVIGCWKERREQPQTTKVIPQTMKVMQEMVTHLGGGFLRLKKTSHLLATCLLWPAPHIKLCQCNARDTDEVQPDATDAACNQICVGCGWESAWGDLRTIDLDSTWHVQPVWEKTNFRFWCPSCEFHNCLRHSIVSRPRALCLMLDARCLMLGAWSSSN